ncbi:MAG TPA: hypothetical protein VG755_06955, partial [Nannocystaceae bacterium]|nr:hypothetical protein [Nannocystaceae bacterium]
QCSTLLGVTVANLPVPIPATPRPLLYAASGLSLEDELLTSTPELSVSPLVAAADHAVGGDPELATIMTGTSVSAAVTAAAAAMAASYNPDGDGWDAMQAVYDGAIPMPDLEATLTMPGDHAEVRRVSICGALTAACEAWGSCGLDTACSSDYELDRNALAFDYGGNEWSPAQSYGAVDDCTVSESICGADTFAVAPGDAPSPNNAMACAVNYLDPVAAFVKPQPPKPPCPACTLTTEEQLLYFTLSSDFSAANVENVTVMITDAVGKEFSVNLGDPPVDSTSTTRLPIDSRALPAGTVVKKAVVEVKISGVKEFNDVLLPTLIPG